MAIHTHPPPTPYSAHWPVRKLSNKKGRRKTLYITLMAQAAINDTFPLTRSPLNPSATTAAPEAASPRTPSRSHEVSQTEGNAWGTRVPTPFPDLGGGRWVTVSVICGHGSCPLPGSEPALPTYLNTYLPIFIPT